MEVKKSKSASLEGKRLQGFLLGLLVAMACLFVGLEYAFDPSDADEAELQALYENDMELPPMPQDDDKLKLAPKVEPKPTVNLVVVEEETEPEVRQDEEPVETDMDDDMEALSEDEMEPPPPIENDVLSLRVVEDVPQFPGGPVEFMKWLTRNLKYPKEMEEQKITGRVVAEFIVNLDGSVTDVNIIASLSPQCDQEVLRVLRMMPRWTPGIQNDQPCRTKVCIPVVFKI